MPLYRAGKSIHQLPIFARFAEIADLPAGEMYGAAPCERPLERHALLNASDKCQMLFIAQLLAGNQCAQDIVVDFAVFFVGLSRAVVV